MWADWLLAVLAGGAAAAVDGLLPAATGVAGRPLPFGGVAGWLTGWLAGGGAGVCWEVCVDELAELYKLLAVAATLGATCSGERAHTHTQV